MDDAYNPVGRPAFTNLYPQQPLPSFAGAGGAAASTAMTTAAPTPVSVGAQMNNPPLILPPLKNQGYSSLAKSQAADYSSLSTELHPSASSSLMPTSTAMATSSMNGICSQLQQGVGSAISSHVMAPSNRRGGRSIAGAMSRPTALSGPSSPTTTSGRPQAPMKDESGKFPCLYCQKKYLHAKHLKRHMLRHTGDRPYECHLCNDTFSRSDILKRHFAKCSQRRGNPTGQDHLALSNARQQNKRRNRSLSVIDRKPTWPQQQEKRHHHQRSASLFNSGGTLVTDGELLSVSPSVIGSSTTAPPTLLSAPSPFSTFNPINPISAAAFSSSLSSQSSRASSSDGTAHSIPTTDFTSPTMMSLEVGGRSTNPVNTGASSSSANLAAGMATYSAAPAFSASNATTSLHIPSTQAFVGYASNVPTIMHSLTDSPLGMAGNMGIPGILDPRSTMQGNSLNGDYNVTSSPSPSPLRHQLPTIDEQRQIGLGINVMGMNASAQSQQSIHAYGRSGDTIGPAIHARNVLSDWQEYLQPCAASFGQMKPPLDSQHSATRPIYVEHDGPIGAFPRATDVLITAPTQPAQMPTDWLFPTGIMTGPHQTFSQIRMRDAQALAAEQAVP